MDRPSALESPARLARPLPRIGGGRATAEDGAHDDARLAPERPAALAPADRLCARDPERNRADVASRRKFGVRFDGSLAWTLDSDHPMPVPQGFSRVHGPWTRWTRLGCCWGASATGSCPSPRAPGICGYSRCCAGLCADFPIYHWCSSAGWAPRRQRIMRRPSIGAGRRTIASRRPVGRHPTPHAPSRPIRRARRSAARGHARRRGRCSRPACGS